MKKTICELFAGVGGFRLGFERLEAGFETVWFSQWEPGAKKQWVHDCYVRHFGECADRRGEIHTGEDISAMDKSQIPAHTVLVGGFPCQDYSVAHTLASSKGIEGKKGVLWWQIRDTLAAGKAPFCLFENVDRLLRSPAKQRGRDLGIILACLNALGYGAAQRRRRVFVFAYRSDTRYGVQAAAADPAQLLAHDGLMARAFPVASLGVVRQTVLDDDVVAVSDGFRFDLDGAGCMRGGRIFTARAEARAESAVPLIDILQKNAPERYVIPEEKREKWAYLKGAKRVPRRTAAGHEYIFSEGPVAFPDRGRAAAGL